MRRKHEVKTLSSPVVDMSTGPYHSIFVGSDGKAYTTGGHFNTIYAGLAQISMCSVSGSRKMGSSKMAL